MQQDFNAELRINKVEVNPFVLSLRIDSLELDDPDGETAVRIREIFGNFQLSSIFRLALTFDEIRFSDPELFVARDNSGVMNFDFLTTPSDGDATVEKETPAEESSIFPVLIYQFLIEDFVVHWADEVPVEPVEIQVGPIVVDIKELNTLPDQSGEQTVVIATENIGTLSWSGDLQLNPFRSTAQASLDGLRFDLISAYIRHQSGIDIVEGGADITLNYDVHESDDGVLNASVDNFNLILSEIVINSFADGSDFDFAGEDQQILKLPKVMFADGQFQWPQKTASIGAISIDQPQIDTARNERGTFNLEPAVIPGSAENPAASGTEETGLDEQESEDNAEDEWKVSIGQVAVNDLVFNLIDASVSPAAQLGVTDFNLKVSDVTNQPGARFPTSLTLQASSGGSVSLNGAVAVLPEPAFKFDLVVDSLALKGLHPYVRQQANLKLNSGAVHMQGKIEASAEEAFAYQGDFEIADLELAESVKNERLASWKSFRTDKLAFSLGKRELNVSLLQFDQLYGDVLIDRNGQLNLGQVAKKDNSGTEDSIDSESKPAIDTDEQTAEVEQAEQLPETETAKESVEPEFKVQIGGIVLNEASADFADLSLPLPFAVKIDELNGKMTTISNQSSEPSEVSLEGKVDEYGFARVNGIVTPLDPKQNTDILLSFENIDVPKFTPYTIPFAGREIKSGSLDLKLGYRVQESELVGENSIILRDFELGKEVPHPDALDIPLGLAVALLKDASGKIDIDLPVSGNVDDPEFSYGSVVWGALGNLLVKVVLSPFSLLGNLLGIEASELETVKFLDGRSDLTPPEMQRAGKLAEALALRPELQLVIKGVSDADADSLALRSAQLDQILEVKIAELTAAGDPSIQYPEHRRTALEQMYREQFGDAPAKMTELQLKFTTEETIEGQVAPVVSFDSLAYVSELNQELAAQQELDSGALEQLAAARASALQDALVAIDETLQARIVISENISVERAEDESIQMPVTLNSQ